MDRRHVLLGGSAVVAAGALAACGGSNESVAEAPVDGGAGADQEFAPPSTLSTNDVPVTGGVILENEKIVVVQPEAGSFAAFTAVCPHQGCPVTSVEANEIICVCHNSKFSSFDGSVLGGPAQQGLAAASISVDGTSITVG